MCAAVDLSVRSENPNSNRDSGFITESEAVVTQASEAGALEQLHTNQSDERHSDESVCEASLVSGLKACMRALDDRYTNAGMNNVVHSTHWTRHL